MASLDKLEGDALESAGWIIFIALVLLVVLGYLAAKDIAIPPSWYPDVAFGRFASWVDQFFSTTPISGGKTQSSVDNWLARIFGWINDNLPHASSSKGWGDYAAKFDGPDSEIQSGLSADDGAQYAEPESQTTDYEIPYEEVSDFPN